MNPERQRLLDIAKQINETAQLVYSAVQGGKGLNFFKCYNEYEEGVFGWIKEHNSFCVAINVYELYTANEGWDNYNDILEEFPEINEVESLDELK